MRDFPMECSNKVGEELHKPTIYALVYSGDEDNVILNLATNKAALNQTLDLIKQRFAECGDRFYPNRYYIETIKINKGIFWGEA